jgi:hypothetical protein
MLFSAFTGSRPATLLAEDDSSSNDSRESSIGDLSGWTNEDDYDRDTLMGVEVEIEPRARTATETSTCSSLKP